MNKYDIRMADALRKAHALSNGLDVRGLLGWHQLKESEQQQWLNLTAACGHYGLYCDTEMAA